MIGRFLEITKDGQAGYWGDRILAQVKYAMKLSQMDGGTYDSLIAAAISHVVSSYETNGAVTKMAVQEAEKLLEELSDKAKRYKMICTAHAHIDMNWMWGWDETVAVALDTFGTMLDLMNEYPGFKFSQSQASVYRIVEEYNPEMLEEIKKRIKEGRWEVTASTWVETDKNMPSGESLARHILYTKRYLTGLLDINPDSLNMDFEPDTFGHSLNVPEILTRGGVKYYYHCRGDEDNGTVYKWLSPSGSSILVYREPNWYNSTIEPSMALYVPEFCKEYGIDTALKVYGVGDHGGGPTRRDIERLMDMSTWPVFPEIRFGTFGEYFSILEKSEASLKAVSGELNFVFDGCYTTQTRIKAGNRHSEALLNEAEIFCSIASLGTGTEYPADELTEAWKNVLFNHFHDILPGSGVTETREYAMGLFQKTMAAANSKRSIALRKICENIDTSNLISESEDIRNTISEGAGVGFLVNKFKVSQTDRGAGSTRIFHIFNPSLQEREEVTEIVVWDWQGDTGRIIFNDPYGNKAEHQIIDKGFNEYWGHKYLRLLVKAKVPAAGYATYVMTEEKIESVNTRFPLDPRVQKEDSFVLENNRLKVTFDVNNAVILSMVDKSTGEELVDASKPAAVFRLIDEDYSKGMTAWTVGRYMNIENLHNNVKIKWVAHSSLRNSITYEMNFRNSKLKATVSLDDNSTILKFDIECDWQETGRWGKGIPQLNFYMPLAYDCMSYKYDVPFGVIEREGMNLDVPANSWAMGMRKDSGRKALMLVTGSKYGFRSVENSMAITLIRSSFDPDPYPEFGIHNFSFGIGVMDSSASNSELIEAAYAFNHSFSVISGKSHKGVFELSSGFAALEEGSVAVSAVKVPEDSKGSKILVRLYETDGNNTRAALRFFKKPKTAYPADINENAVNIQDAAVAVDNERVTFNASPYAVITLIVEF